jgi:hypothetical protein
MDTQFISELAARIPYGIVCEMGPKNDIKIVEKLNLGGLDQLIRGNWEIKPYVFSDLAYIPNYKVESEILNQVSRTYVDNKIEVFDWGILIDSINSDGLPVLFSELNDVINILRKYHIDANDWIARGLGICANGKNIYNFEK